MEKYIALLRGINVGGHHKVPMAELCNQMERLGFENVGSILNTGNIIFEAKKAKLKTYENKIRKHIETFFSFPIPVVVVTAETIQQLFSENPFSKIKVTKDTRCYVSFLLEDEGSNINLPWRSEDLSYTILSKNEGLICSVLDLSQTKTPKAMEALEKFYGKDITTRNWNSIQRIAKKL